MLKKNTIFFFKNNINLKKPICPPPPLYKKLYINIRYSLHKADIPLRWYIPRFLRQFLLNDKIIYGEKIAWEKLVP